MKDVSRWEFTTKLYEVENHEDLGLEEVEKFISETIDKHVMNTFAGEWITKFERVEVSPIRFCSDRDDNRGGDHVILGVNSELIHKLKESPTLSKYKVDYIETSQEPTGDVLITFITTSKY